MKYSLVIPVFNEEGNLEFLQDKIDKTMKPLKADFEVIYVDDLSSDGSLQVMKNMQSKYPEIKVVSLKKKSGQSAALYAGFMACLGQWIITLDADCQNPPEEILRLTQFENEFDFISGIRKKRGDNFLRKTSSAMAKFARKAILKDPTQDTGCALRLFKKDIISSIYFFRNFHRFFPYLARLHGFKVKETPITHEPRYKGRSKYKTFNRLVEGLFDLWGVFWLKKRTIKHGSKTQY
ncbi:MAG: glycosyltransferase family 2 protein [Candidatus Omnitrophica bacterium]|nr:glycosyltransferase family 2 protein [Candidatus Omnitrophota bacterium]